jgi:hypothetical protein
LRSIDVDEALYPEIAFDHIDCCPAVD